MLETIYLFGILIVVFGIILILSISQRKVRPGQALIKYGGFTKRTKVCRSSAIILPYFHGYNIIDLTEKKIEIRRENELSLQCADGIRINVVVEFSIAVNENDDDILYIAESIGCETTFNNQGEVEQLFHKILNGALSAVASKFSFDQLKRNEFKKMLKAELTEVEDSENKEDIEFKGYQIKDIAIQLIQQLSNLDFYNENNINDQKGIKEIRSQLSKERIASNEEKRTEEETINQRNQESEIRKRDLEKKELKDKASLTEFKRAQEANEAKAEVRKKEILKKKMLQWKVILQTINYSQKQKA